MQLSASPPARSPGVTWLAALLIASPLVQWAYVSALSYLTILEPPLTGSRGIPLAMQLFFAPGNIIAIVLGVMPTASPPACSQRSIESIRRRSPR